MECAVGLMEMKNISRAVVAADTCLKTAAVNLYCRTTCPGKFLIIVTGGVSAVQSAMEAAVKAAEGEFVDYVLLGKVDASVLPALMGTACVEKSESLGVIETFSVPAAVKAADIAAKSAAISIIEIRAAQGLGGKGLVYYTGGTSAVQFASEAVISHLAAEGSLVDAVVIPSPHAELWSMFM